MGSVLWLEVGQTTREILLSGILGWPKIVSCTIHIRYVVLAQQTSQLPALFLPRKRKELPWVGFKPTALCRALSYQGHSRSNLQHSTTQRQTSNHNIYKLSDMYYIFREGAKLVSLHMDFRVVSQQHNQEENAQQSTRENGRLTSQ